LDKDQTIEVQSYHIETVNSRPSAYEGHLFHDQISLSTHTEAIQAKAGDVLVFLNQPNARYAVETLEPQAHDSFFRWGFFNSILEKKEHFSDYVFEDSAAEMLEAEPELRKKFDQWKLAHSELLGNQEQVLSFIYTQGKRHHEPEWRRYPVYAVFNTADLA
jgi:hypothetical protein